MPNGWDPWQYLLLMAGCLLITAPLELLLRARVYARPKRLLLALAPVVVLYTIWDIVGIARHHWWYSPKFTTGWHVPGTPMPVEELVFFIVIPICGLLTYGAVGTCLDLLARWRAGGPGGEGRRNAGGPQRGPSGSTEAASDPNRPESQEER